MLRDAGFAEATLWCRVVSTISYGILFFITTFLYLLKLIDNHFLSVDAKQSRGLSVFDISDHRRFTN